jgi:hypothetical protein
MMVHHQTVEAGVKMFSQMREEAVVDLHGVAVAHLNRWQCNSTSIVPAGMLLICTLTCKSASELLIQ